MCSETFAWLASGDTVITETIDAHGFDKDGVQHAPEPNPMNSPIFVIDAEPGDALKIEILRMTPIRATGWTRVACQPPQAAGEQHRPSRQGFVERRRSAGLTVMVRSPGGGVLEPSKIRK